MIDRHVLAAVSLSGVMLDLMGGLYLAYERLTLEVARPFLPRRPAVRGIDVLVPGGLLLWAELGEVLRA